MANRGITGRPNIASARMRARQLFEDANVDSIPLLLPKIIKHLESKHDLAVMSYPFGKNISGILVTIEGKPTIGINSDEPLVRKRFTVAHEIGHFVMGHGSCDLCADSNEEREANQFAAELLMPPSLLRDDFKRESDIGELSKKYMVSMEALRYQLIDCGVL